MVLGWQDTTFYNRYLETKESGASEMEVLDPTSKDQKWKKDFKTVDDVMNRAEDLCIDQMYRIYVYQTKCFDMALSNMGVKDNPIKTEILDFTFFINLINYIDDYEEWHTEAHELGYKDREEVETYISYKLGADIAHDTFETMGRMFTQEIRKQFLNDLAD
jgi:hypothetical protein